MIKIKKLFLMALVLCLFTGCNSNKAVSGKKIADTVITLYKDTNYKTSGLSRIERNLINDLIENEKPENKIINLNQYIIEGDLEESEEDSTGVYKKNNNYYIKYEDLNFKEGLIGEDLDNTYEIASVYANKHFIFLYKDEIYLIGTNTSDDAKFTYKYLGYEENKNDITYFYQSYYDDSGLLVKINMENNKFTNIELEYLPIYKEPKKDK